MPGMGVARASYWFFKQHAEVAVRRCRRRGARARWPSLPAIGSPAGASTARLGVTPDDLRHLQIVAVTSLPETFRDAVTVLRVAILAHLPLALESRDRKTEPDDASQHRIDVARRSIREHPWLSFVPLLLSGQLAHVAVQPVLVFHHFGTAIGMDDRIVPCRHDLPVQSLRRIPIGRDVTLGSLKDHQRLVTLSKFLSVRIGAREMAFNDSVRSIPLEHGWEVIGIETTGAARYERSKGPGAHQRVHLRDILDAIMIRLVHGDHRDPRSQRQKAKLLARSKRCRCRRRVRRGPGDAVRRKPARRFSPLISLGFGLCTLAPVIALAWRRLVPASLSGDHPSVGHNSFLQCGFTPVFVLYVVTIGRAPPERGPAPKIARHKQNS